MIIKFEVNTHDRAEIRHTIECLEKLLLPASKRVGQWRVQKWTQKIKAIKVIRDYSQMGLKEAKKLADDAEFGWVSFSAPCEFFREIENFCEGLQFMKSEDDEDGSPLWART